MEGLRALKSRNGFSVAELLISAAIVGLASLVFAKPAMGWLQRLRLQNAADDMKHFMINARMRAISNPDRHCGVVFRTHASSSIDDSLFAFLEENPPDNLYTAGRDSLYLQPLVISKKKTGISLAIPQGSSSLLVFRGDGSATASTKVLVNLGNTQDTLDVLASTGRIRVASK